MVNKIYTNKNNILFNLDGKGNSEAKSLDDHKKFWKKFIKAKIMDFEEQRWLKNMKDRSKLQNYALYKKKLKLEKYLLGKYSRGRMYHTSLRSGTNVLEIEKGRWSHIHKDSRFCKQCDLKKVEDERHFLLDCKKYQTIRNQFFDMVDQVSFGKWKFSIRNPEETFVLLLQGTGDDYELDIFNLFHKYLENCFKLRTN